MRSSVICDLKKPIGRLIFGCSNARMNRGEDCSALLDAAMEAGINAFDTARVYNKSEASLGHWLRRQERSKVVVVTKCCHPGPLGNARVREKCARADISRSLDALGTDHTDILLLHRDDPALPAEEIVEMMNALVREGLTRAIGVSNWTCARIARANAHAEKKGLVPFSVTSPHFSLGEQVRPPWRGCLSLTGEKGKEDLLFCERTRLPVFAYSSLCGGLFSGKLRADEPDLFRRLPAPARKGYLCEDNLERLRRAEKLAKEKGATVAQIVTAWMFSQPLELFAVISCTNPARIAENAAALELSLTKEECDYLALRTPSER